jgi:hypothetical protein
MRKDSNLLSENVGESSIGESSKMTPSISSKSSNQVLRDNNGSLFITLNGKKLLIENTCC